MRPLFFASSALIALCAVACDPTVPPPAPEPEAIPCEGIWEEGHTPEAIDVYSWGGEEYFHADFGCCDRYLELYDMDCNYVCAPSGGFMGTGDGTCTTFYDEATFVETVWPAP